MNDIILYIIEIALVLVILGIIKKIASCALKIAAVVVIAIIMAVLYFYMAQ